MELANGEWNARDSLDCSMLNRPRSVQAVLGLLCRGYLGKGQVWQSGTGQARRVLVRCAEARTGTVRQSRFVEAEYVVARRVQVRRGKERQPWKGMVSCVWACQGAAR